MPKRKVFSGESIRKFRISNSEIRNFPISDLPSAISQKALGSIIRQSHLDLSLFES